ncbi:CPBP family intramembrane glutamic endopeptidase [Gilvimarinus xylanilyticus]|uniref:CPBP family intramembrane metalloprotease n=1 Tax=Gilvimarinus xylanilyticus TaxID=2944139 RepID=A0A9X2HSX6_9GAMM|nr:type II CAAX endopeptidase family protein [Gilvimarinus xylanilyticus]MCP8897685.1 CPBP family intramembrane metalloprotease [Gilvimarinus xylanilyticus]
MDKFASTPPDQTRLPISVRAFFAFYFFFIILWLPVLMLAEWTLDQWQLTESADEIVSSIGFYLAMLGALLYTPGSAKVVWRKAYDWPSKCVWPGALILTLLCVAITPITVYLVWTPMSYIAPDFFYWWLTFDTDFLGVNEQGKVGWVALCAMFVAVVILAPLFEEWVFRGVILHRWCGKYGVVKAAVFSSLLFAVLHIHLDIVGAFFFALIMSFLYLKTHTLWVPVVCHSINNGIAFVWSYTDYRLYGIYDYTPEMFRAEAVQVLYAIPLLILLAVAYRRWPLPPGTLGFPRIIVATPTTDEPARQNELAKS